jgi:large subunit ribosomal protein L54
VSQPLSTPEGVHVDVDPTQPSKAAKKVERHPSSCEPGAKLIGLNYFKNKPDLIAMEDEEYPEWLWTLLDSSNKEVKKGGVDPSSMYIGYWSIEANSLKVLTLFLSSPQ